VKGSVHHSNRSVILDYKTTLPGIQFNIKKKHEIIKFYTQKLYTSTEKSDIAKFLHLRGCVYLDYFEYDLCENDYLESLTFNKENALLYYDLCDLCIIQKRYKEGIEFGEKSISLNSNFPLGLLLLINL
jgi:tetratricopeptide (TPR) repeat protein